MPTFYYSLFLLHILFALSTQEVQVKCLESNTHKPHPESESNLYGECAPWKDMACCNSTSTESIHVTNVTWNGFNYNHCGRISAACKRRFTQELCMYECDPYMKNWIVGDSSKKMRNERYYKIPFCKKDCDQWFNDCKNDYTCRDNWSYGFVWRGGINYCRPEDKCVTIKEMYNNSAEKFCKMIWDDSFVIEPQSDRCFTMEFEVGKPNPNKAAAEFYEKKNKN